MFQGASPRGALATTTWWMAQMIRRTRSWRGSSGQPLRGPASGRNLGRGGGPASTENHVSLATRRTFLSRAKRCTDPLTVASSLFLCLSAQWGGRWGTVWQQRRPMLSAYPAAQRCKCDLDIKTPGYPFTAPSMPRTQTGNPLPSGLAWRCPPVLTSWHQFYSFGLHQAWYKRYLKRVDER